MFTFQNLFEIHWVHFSHTILENYVYKIGNTHLSTIVLNTENIYMIIDFCYHRIYSSASK